MIIDLILDRKDGFSFDATAFKNSILDYELIFPEEVEPIAKAYEDGRNEVIQKALCDHIVNNEYNHEISEWVMTQDWTEENINSTDLCKSLQTIARNFNVEGLPDEEDLLRYWYLMQGNPYKVIKALADYITNIE